MQIIIGPAKYGQKAIYVGLTEKKLYFFQTNVCINVYIAKS